MIVIVFVEKGTVFTGSEELMETLNSSSYSTNSSSLMTTSKQYMELVGVSDKNTNDSSVICAKSSSSECDKIVVNYSMQHSLATGLTAGSFTCNTQVDSYIDSQLSFS